jgi:outer membrane protein assembly factor BamB
MRPLLVFALMTFLAGNALLSANWPHWRGPAHNGVSPETALPVTWGASCEAQAAQAPAAPASRGRGSFGFGQEGRPLTPLACAKFKTENIAWSLPLPAYSGSTPIIWGDRIFLNVATAANSGELELWAIDRRAPSVVWKRRLADANHMERKQNMSSPSPVTDGRHVWVMTGVGILKAFDFDGKEIWARDIQKDYGRFGLNWGYASSPLLKGDALYVQVLHGMKTDDPSYVLKIDANSGKTLWRVERPTPAQHESPDSYATPTWIEANGRTELIVTGGDVVSGHDPATGKDYWRADVLNPDRNRAYRIVASPILADGRIYVTTEEDGKTTVFRAGPKFEILSTNSLLGDCSPYCLSTVAVSEGQLFMRTSSFLWAIGKRRSGS